MAKATRKRGRTGDLDHCYFGRLRDRRLWCRDPDGALVFGRDLDITRWPVNAKIVPVGRRWAVMDFEGCEGGAEFITTRTYPTAEEAFRVLCAIYADLRECDPDD